MRGTLDVVRALALANPGREITEDQVRWVLRRGLIPSLERVAGRLVWADEDVIVLARLLGIAAPAPDTDRRPVGST